MRSTLLKGRTLRTPDRALQSFSIYRTAAQTLGTAAGTKVQFDTKALPAWDVSGIVDTSLGRVTPTIAGEYHFGATVFLNTALASTQSAWIMLYKNGALHKLGQQLNANGTQAAGGWCLLLDARAQANGTTDYFEIFIGFQGPASLAVLTGAGNNYFGGELIGKS